jgi:hypothetical protein
VRQKNLFGFGQPEGTPGPRDAQAILSPYADELVGCIQTGWGNYHSEVTPAGRSKLEPRTRANIVNDFARDHALATFSGRPDLHTCTDLGFFKLYVADRLVLRIKKLGPDLLVANVQTDQQRDWYNNEPVRGIPTDHLRLNLGYRLTPAADAIADVLITWQASWHTLGWCFSILAEPGDQIRPIDSPHGPQPSPMPLPEVEIIPRIAKTGEQAK